jgi:2-polyprenyl-3-methyl-5-hydroxy-6-metoxy-1,4-benzoquinol methylase
MDEDGSFEQLYKDAGEMYERIPWAALAPRPALIDWLDRAAAGDGAPALVIACGLGDDAEELALRGFSVQAFDHAPTAITQAHRRFPESVVDYRVADLFALPLAWRGRFERVIEVQTIQSIPPGRHRAAIAAIAATVAPGGKLFLRAGVRAGDQPATQRPWLLTWSELEWFSEEGLVMTDRFDSHDHDVYVHVEYTRSGPIAPDQPRDVA